MIWHLITLTFAGLALYTEDTGGAVWYTMQALFVVSMVGVNAILKAPDDEHGDTVGDHVIDDITRIDHGLTLDRAASDEPVLDIFALEKGRDYD